MIAAIENAILARLRAAAAADILGYRWATLETYPANWDEYLRDKLPRSPGAWAVFGGARKGEVEGIGGVRLPASFGVVVMAENARNETAQRQGGPIASEPGSYQLAEDVIALLNGQTLGLDIDALKVVGLHFVRTQALTKDRKVSLLAVELETAFVFRATDFPPRDIGDFRFFHADWDAPPTGHVDADPAAPGVQLPDDAHASAIDHVTLETRP